MKYTQVRFKIFFKKNRTFPLASIELALSQPLLSQGLAPFDNPKGSSRLVDLFHKTLQPSFSYKDRLSHHVAPMCVKVILGIGGALGRIPLIPLALNFQKQIPFIGPIFAATNFVSYSAYLVWASSMMVDKLFYRFMVQDQNTLSGSCSKVALLGFSIISGSIAQVPYFILSYDYNKQTPYMVALNALDVTLPIYSLHMMSSNVLLLFHSSQIEKKLNQIKDLLCQRLQLRMNYMRNTKISDEMLSAITNVATPDLKANLVMDLLAQDPMIPSTKTTSTVSQKSAYCLGTILLCVQMAWFAYLCEKGIDKVSSNIPLKVFFCAYVVIANIALTQFVLVGSSFQAIRGVSNLTCCKSPSLHISETLFPNAALIFRILSVIISATAFIPAATMSQDYLVESLFWPSTILYGLGFALMDYLPLRELLSDTASLAVLMKKDSPHKTLLSQYTQLEELKSIVEHADAKTLARFLLSTSSSEGTLNLLEEASVSIQELQDYVRL